MRLPNICRLEKANNLRSTLYIHTQPLVYMGYTCVFMCIAIFGRIEIRPQKAIGTAVGCREIRKPHPFRGLDMDVCGPFLFMKLPINARWQGFPFHSSTCPTRDPRATLFSFCLFLSLFEYLLYFFSLVSLLLTLFF